jgi:hypothetical protein
MGQAPTCPSCASWLEKAAAWLHHRARVNLRLPSHGSSQVQFPFESGFGLEFLDVQLGPNEVHGRIDVHNHHRHHLPFAESNRSGRVAPTRLGHELIRQNHLITTTTLSSISPSGHGWVWGWPEPVVSVLRGRAALVMPQLWRTRGARRGRQDEGREPLHRHSREGL